MSVRVGYHARMVRRAARSLLRSQPRPLLVHQMAKVGSTAVCRALEAAGLHPLQVHFLGNKTAPARASYSHRGIPLPEHMYLERLLGVYLRITRHRLKVITLFRDPIARVVSSAYQTRDRDAYDTESVEAMVERLGRELSDPAVLEYCYSWFDDEIRAVFGADILGQPFDRSGGVSQVAGRRADILVVKLERLEHAWPAIGSFVAREVRPIHANLRSEGVGSATYDAVLASLKLPRAHVERLYDHPWMRHFYTETERSQFIDRWSA